MLQWNLILLLLGTKTLSLYISRKIRSFRQLTHKSSLLMLLQRQAMDLMISNWSNVETVPESYTFPADRRPNEQASTAPFFKDLPVLDLESSLSDDANGAIQTILEACQELGCFQVINHGLSEALMDDTMSMFKEFFSLPAEYKASFFSNDPDKACRLYSSTLNYDKEEHHYWRDNFTHRCHPLEDYIHLWPQKPTRYREVVGRYSVEVRKLLMRILGLISEGLGIEDGYFESELSKTQLISVNHHIPCPDPSLTLGMPEHCDPNLITALHQRDVPGLQVLKDGQWFGVEPLPHAFLVIPGLQLRVISNERFTSPKHRVVTHREKPRTTIGTFLIPSHEVLIEPAKALVRGSSPSSGPPVYRAFTYRDFFGAFTGKSCDAESALGCFKL